MTRIDIPDPLWEIEIRYQYPDKPPYDVSEYEAELRFCDLVVYSTRYSETENADVFEHTKSFGSEEPILDHFKAQCAFKMHQMFHSWGGPVR